MADSSVPVPFFEGVEKRLQIDFAVTNLREMLTQSILEEIVKPVECVIEGVLSGDKVDAYLLSASSLFVYDDVVIIKTCGATKIFECIPRILDAVRGVAVAIKYSRGSFFRPELQPFPHRSFPVEEENLKLLDLSFDKTKAKVFGDDEWHLFSSSSSSSFPTEDMITIEVCMRGLDREKASLFYKKAGKAMLDESGVGKIFPEARLSAHEFEPCGFFMNTLEGNAVSTIHVSPQPECSFASFEAFGYNLDNGEKLSGMVRKVLDCFYPQDFTLAYYCPVALNKEVDVDLNGYRCTGKDMTCFGPFRAVFFSFKILE